MTVLQYNGASLARACFTVAIAMLSACASRASRPPAGPDGVVGHGSHEYRFTLDKPTGGVAANAPFALSLGHKRDLPFVPEEKDVWRGVTDAQGRTPIFALPFAITPDDVFLRGRLGDGPFGEQFNVEVDGGAAVPGYAYRLIICTDPPQYMVGLTGKDGETFYGASQTPVSVLLYDVDYDIAKGSTAGLSTKQQAHFAAENIKRCAEGSDDDVKENE